MRGALAFAAIGETMTGFALLIIPSWIGRLLSGAELTGVAAIAARQAIAKRKPERRCPRPTRPVTRARLLRN